jgi:UDP-glucose 4-epimerase
MDEFFDGKRILITGGLGFIGSNLAHRLVALGARVCVVDSMIPAYGATLDNIAEIKDDVRINFSDVRDRHSMSYIVKEQDLIFSLAGQVSHSESMRDPLTDLEINCHSQLTLLDCCRQGNPGVKIVFASTRQIYGKPNYLPVDEAHPLDPVDVNGINKLAAELYYTLYHNVHGIATVSLRLTNTYGQRMDLNSDIKGFAGIFIRKALRGERIQLFGTGEQRRDFNHVDDVVDALLQAAMTPSVNGEVYNLGHGEHHSLIEFLEILQEFTTFEVELVPFPPAAQAIDIGDYYGDFSKFTATTGWEPSISLRTGLQKTIDYFRSNGWSE